MIKIIGYLLAAWATILLIATLSTGIIILLVPTVVLAYLAYKMFQWDRRQAAQIRQLRHAGNRTSGHDAQGDIAGLGNW